MSHLTDDEIRAIWSILPLDQEPTVENLIAYTKQLEENYNRVHDIEIENSRVYDEVRNIQSQLYQLNDQYNVIMENHIALATRNSHISDSANKYYNLRNPQGINKLIEKYN